MVSDIIRGPIGATGPRGPQGWKGGKGQKGEKGDPGVGGNYTVVAGEDIGGHRAVYVENGEAFYVDTSTVGHAGRCVGITTGAAALGDAVEIQPSSSMTEVSWSWDITKPIYLGSNGQLTQTAPTIGFIQILGIPTSATSMIIQISEAILV